jgi:parallel beta-helix repeat protein
VGLDLRKYISNSKKTTSFSIFLTLVLVFAYFYGLNAGISIITLNKQEKSINSPGKRLYRSENSTYTNINEGSTDSQLQKGNDLSREVYSQYKTTLDISKATSFNNHYYQFYDQVFDLSWDDAKILCELNGGHLVTISSQEENDFVNMLAEWNVIWIGFTDERIEGTWEWITNESVTYTNWYPYEPNDAGGEDYAEMNSDGGWNDIGSDSSLPFVCEWSFRNIESSVDPLNIHNNSDFAEIITKNDWSGNGTENDPYIIENQIIYSDDNQAINIRNTEVHFIIRNCTLVGGFYSLKMTNVTHAVVFQNIIEGLEIKNTSKCKFIQNNFTTHWDTTGPVFLRYSINNSLVNNSFNNTELLLFWSGNNTVEDNQFINEGITLFGSVLEDYIQENVTGNVVNNRPCVYWLNESNRTVPTDVGQIYLVNCSNILVANQQMLSTTKGIGAYYSEFVDIVNNSLSNLSGYNAIGLYSSNNCTIQRNVIYGNSRWGVSITNSINCTILINSVFSNGRSGINIINCSDINFSNNDCWSNFENGIELSHSQLIVITNNSIFGNEDAGISLNNSSKLIISKNTIEYNNIGMKLTGDNEITVEENQIYSNYHHSINISESIDSLISNNTITNWRNPENFLLQFSVNITIQDNIISGGDNGLVIIGSSSCLAINNTISISGDAEGIMLNQSENCIVSENAFDNCKLVLLFSGNNTITNNSFTEYGIGLFGWELKHFLQTEVSNNILNGNTILYWQNEVDTVVPAESPQIFLVNCTRIKVSNFTLSGAADGLIAAFCDNIDITNNSITADNGHVGIGLYYTNYSVLRNNHISQYYLSGIRIFGVTNCVIMNNIVVDNDQTGIHVVNSSQIFLSGNNCDNNRVGMRIIGSENSSIHENSFSGNRGSWWEGGTGVEIIDSSSFSFFQNNFSSNMDIGFWSYNNNNLDILNSTIEENLFGLRFSLTSDSIIANCTISNHVVNGIDFDNSNKCIIENNIFSNADIGIYIQNSTNFDMRLNVIEESYCAINLEDSSNCSITNNNITSVEECMILISSVNVTIQKSHISETSRGITLEYSAFCLIRNNSFNLIGGAGIEISHSHDNAFNTNTITQAFSAFVIRSSIDNLIQNNEISEVLDGISIDDSTSCLCTDNSISNVMGSGISLVYSNNIVIQTNTISESSLGISLHFSQDNLITNNSISSNIKNDGILIRLSDDNEITQNSFRSTTLTLEWSGNNLVVNNSFSNIGMSVFGVNFNHFLQAEVVNNTIDGDPILYWQNEENNEVPSNVQQVFLVNCTSITVAGLNLLNIGDGIIVAHSDNIIISDNVLTTTSGFIGIALYNTNNSIITNTKISHYTHMGILIREGNNNKIIDCNIFNNDGSGIQIEYSVHITLKGNQFNRNLEDGIVFISTSNSTLTKCIMNTNQGFGIYINSASSYNNVILNDFIGNNLDGDSQAFDGGVNNTFSNNYWNDWISPDTNQNGYVDFPYYIEGAAENEDRLPRTISSREFYLYIPPNLAFGIPLLILIGVFLRFRFRKKEA